MITGTEGWTRVSASSTRDSNIGGEARRTSVLLDGSLIAVCALYVAWTLAVEPANHGPGPLVVALPAAFALCVWGVLAVLVRRAERPRGSLAATAVSVGATLAADVSRQTLPEVQKQLGMKEGFDVGLEMSGNPAAFRDMLANMAHGGKIAMLGIPDKEMAIEWNTVIFNMLTIKGIYGREMYETWYKMSVMLESGLDIKPVITHRLKWNEFAQGFAAMKAGDAGKVVLDWRGLQ